MEVSYNSALIMQHEKLIDFICRKADNFSIIFPLGYRFLSESAAKTWLLEEGKADQFLSERIQAKLRNQAEFSVHSDYIFKSVYYKDLKYSLVSEKAILDCGANLRYEYKFTLDENSIAWLKKKLKNINELKSNDFCVTPRIYAFKSIRFFNNNMMILGTNLFYEYLYLECNDLDQRLLSNEDITYLQNICLSYKNPVVEFINEYYVTREQGIDLTDYFARTNYENMVFVPNTYYHSDRNLNLNDFHLSELDLEESKLRKKFFQEVDNRVLCLNILKRRKEKLKLDEIYAIIKYYQTSSSCREPVLELLKELPEDKVLNAFFTMLLSTSFNQKQCDGLFELFKDLGFTLANIADNTLCGLYKDMVSLTQKPVCDIMAIMSLESAKKEFCSSYEKTLIT